jgi:hypothetical protein
LFDKVIIENRSKPPARGADDTALVSLPEGSRLWDCLAWSLLVENVNPSRVDNKDFETAIYSSLDRVVDVLVTKAVANDYEFGLRLQ